MNFDLGELSGTPGEKLHVTAVEFFETSVVVEDADGIHYRAYYDQQPKWQTIGRPYLGQVGCTLYGEVGQGSTEGYNSTSRLLRFFVREFISLPEPEQTPLQFDMSNDIPRSPYDVVTAVRSKTRKGDCSFTISLPCEEDRIVVNSLCEKAKEAGLVKHKGHYPGQHFKAWLLEQAMSDGLLQISGSD
jgi:hypothetical protein